MTNLNHQKILELHPSKLTQELIDSLPRETKDKVVLKRHKWLSEVRLEEKLNNSRAMNKLQYAKNRYKKRWLNSICPMCGGLKNIASKHCLACYRAEYMNKKEIKTNEKYCNRRRNTKNKESNRSST